MRKLIGALSCDKYTMYLRCAQHVRHTYNYYFATFSSIIFYLREKY